MKIIVDPDSAEDLKNSPFRILGQHAKCNDYFCKKKQMPKKTGYCKLEKVACSWKLKVQIIE